MIANEGASKSRNDGLHVATGEFIGFCDADDVWNPEKLQIQLNLLQSNLDYALTYCDTLIIDENGAPTGQRFSELFPPTKTQSGRIFNELIGRNFINLQGVLMRTECVQRVGYFDEAIKWVEDWWYWIRLARDYRFLYAAKPLARYRVHSRSTNLIHKRSYCVNRFKVFRRILREYADLLPTAKADIVFKMGVDLCDISKFRVARRLLWSAVGSSLTDPRCLGTSCKALRRLVLSNPAFSRNLEVAPLPSVNGSAGKSLD